MMKFTGQCQLEYVQSKLVAWIEQEIVRYYLSLIPKFYYIKPQLYPAHITVVRSHPIDIIKNCEVWGKYKGCLINFEYSGEVQYSEPYFYLDVWSEEFGNIREELGLPRYRIGFNCFHITIGNCKKL